MKKILSLLTLLVCALGTIWAQDSGTDQLKSGSVSASNETWTATSVTLDGNYVAGNGSTQSSGMSSKGAKLRTQRSTITVDGTEYYTIVLTVNEGYVVKSFSMIAGSNGSSDVIAKGLFFDNNTATNYLSGDVTMTKATAGSMSATGLNATTNIIIAFDKSSYNQINAEMTIGWEVATSGDPVDPVFSLSASEIAVGETAQIKVGNKNGLDGLTLSDLDFNNTVISIDEETGLVTGLDVGSTPITFTTASTDKYNAGRGELSITVVAPTVEAPDITPNGAYFAESVQVSISTITEGADIWYSVDGGTSWTDYSAPFTLTETTTVQAKATKSNYTDSEVTTATFTKVTLDERTTVGEATTWDWSKYGTSGIQLNEATTPKKNDFFVLSNISKYGYAAPAADFGPAQALEVSAEYVVRDGKYFQGGYVKFMPTVRGNVEVTFSNTGNRDSEDLNRILYINGNTEAKSMTSKSFTTGSADVKANEEVVIKGVLQGDGSDQYLRISKIVFTPLPDVYSIVGDVTGGWDTDVVMEEQNSGLYRVVIRNFEAVGGQTYYYKLRDNYDWDGYTLPNGNDNYEWTCPETGKYTLFFIANIGGEEISGVPAYTVVLDVNPQYKDFTVTFANGGLWDHVYAYAWNGDGDSAVPLVGAWPGTEIEKTGMEEVYLSGYTAILDIYTFTYRGFSAPEHIIFNNGGNGQQTEDLDFEEGQRYGYYLTDYTVQMPASSELRTLCAPYPLEFGGKGNVYVAQLSGNRVTFKPIDYAPAGTGVLVKDNAGNSFSCGITDSGNLPRDMDGNEVTDNALIGVLEATEVPAGSFVLMNADDGLGFYKTLYDFTVGANTAYLPASAGAAGMIRINLDDVATAIEKAESQRSDSPVYNLQGQRVAQPQKGLYIQGGRKVVVK